MLNILFAHMKWHTEMMENRREKQGERERLQRIAAEQPVTYSKMSAGGSLFTKAGRFKANQNKRTVNAQMNCRHQHPVQNKHHHQQTLAWKQSDQGNSNMFYSYMLTEQKMYTLSKMFSQGHKREKRWLELILFTSAPQDGAFSC